MYKNLTEEEKDLIFTLAEIPKLTTDEIGKKIGRTGTWIRVFLFRHGIKRPPKNLKNCLTCKKQFNSSKKNFCSLKCYLNFPKGKCPICKLRIIRGIEKYCRKCFKKGNQLKTNLRVKKWIKKNKKRFLEIHRKYYRKNGKKIQKVWQKKNKIKIYQLQEKCRRKYPGKFYARYKLRYFVKIGKIKRGKCKICKKSNAEAHHPDYRKPLYVKWYCREHHMILHRKY